MEPARIDVELDHRRVRCAEELEAWATEAFGLSPSELQLERPFLMTLYRALQNRGTRGCYVVAQRWTSLRSKEMAGLLDGEGGRSGWIDALGFHLSREGTGASVRFE